MAQCVLGGVRGDSLSGCDRPKVELSGEVRTESIIGPVHSVFGSCTAATT